MAEKDSDLGAFLSGFIIGGLVGAVVALLLAPQSGEETRALIRDKSIELKDKAVETAEEARTRTESAAAEARTRVAELSQQARDRASELKTRGQAVYEEQREKIKKALPHKKPAVTPEEESPTEPEA